MTEPQLAHIVFFTLHDASPAACQRLVDACNLHLANHPGCTFMNAGLRVADLSRPVNDQEFHVALHMVFATRADHDRYQTTERHLQFIAENKASWKQVRVFDSYVAL